MNTATVTTTFLERPASPMRRHDVLDHWLTHGQITPRHAKPRPAGASATSTTRPASAGTPASTCPHLRRRSPRLSEADAEVIGPQIEVLAEEGDASKERVRDIARSPNSPLHRFFDWDKDVAADKWQLHQADAMLRSIRVRVIEDGRPKTAPAYKVEQAQPKSAFARGHNVLHGESAAAVQKAKEAFDELVA